MSVPSTTVFYAPAATQEIDHVGLKLQVAMLLPLGSYDKRARVAASRAAPEDKNAGHSAEYEAKILSDDEVAA